MDLHEPQQWDRRLPLLTDGVKADAAALWAKLLALYDGGAHTALGYQSWGTYYEAEFGQSDATAYRLFVVCASHGSTTHG